MFLKIATFVIISLLMTKTAVSAEKVIYEKNSLYQYIVVTEDKSRGERYVYNSRSEGIHGGIKLSSPETLLFEYTQMAFIGLAFMDKLPANALFIGLGAGSMPKYFNKYFPDAAIDMVEVDPEMLHVAQKFFYFKENEKMKIHIFDGRVFIKKFPRKYDMIFLDAFRNGAIPFHLTTVEFLEELKKRLNPGGLVVSNILSRFNNQFFDSMVVTYQKAFENLYIFRGRNSYNYAFVAAMQRKHINPSEIVKRTKAVQSAKGLNIDLSSIAANYDYTSNTKDSSADILTDDFAPAIRYLYGEAL